MSKLLKFLDVNENNAIKSLLSNVTKVSIHAGFTSIAHILI